MCAAFSVVRTGVEVRATYQKTFQLVLLVFAQIGNAKMTLYGLVTFSCRL